MIGSPCKLVARELQNAPLFCFLMCPVDQGFDSRSWLDDPRQRVQQAFDVHFWLLTAVDDARKQFYHGSECLSRCVLAGAFLLDVL